MQNLHNFLIFYDRLHNHGKLFSNFAYFEIIKKKKGRIIIIYFFL